VCRKLGISERRFPLEESFGGLMPSECASCGTSEGRTSRLRKLVADLTLDKEMLPGH
jgi:putative transposase